MAKIWDADEFGEMPKAQAAPQKPKPKSAWRSFIDSLTNRDWGNTADVISDAVVRGAADAANMVGKAANVGNYAQNPRAAYETLKEALTGQDVVGQKLNKAIDENIGSPVPQDVADRYAHRVVQRVVGNAPFAPLGPLEAVTSGIGMGVGGQSAAEAFPGNDLAEFLGEAAGGIAGGVSPHVKPLIQGKLRIRAGMQDPDYGRMVNEIIPEIESNFNPKAVSPKGARGLMQVMPETAKKPGHGIRPSNGSPADDVRVGKQLYAALLGKYGDHEKALAAYNWGEGHVDNAIKAHGDDYFYHMPKETQDYVAKGMTKAFGGPRTTGNGSVPPISPEDMARATGDKGMQEALGLTDDIDWTNPNLFDDENLVVENDRSPRPADDLPEGVADLSFERDVRKAKDKIKDTQENWDDASADFIPQDNTGYEKYTQYPQEKIPANDTETFKSLEEFLEPATGNIKPEWRFEAKKYADAQRAAGKPEIADWIDRRLPEPDLKLVSEPDFEEPSLSRPERDTNPPASSNTFGTKSPEGRNRPPAPKSPDGHGEEPPSGGAEEPPIGEEPPVDQPEETVFDKLYKAIQRAKGARTRQNNMRTVERSKRVNAMLQARQATSGVEGFYAEKKHLKGELPSAQYAALHDLTEEDINGLFEHVKNHPSLGPLQSITAREGLAKLLQGEVPNKTELNLLSRTLPPKLYKAMLGNRGIMAKLADVGAGIWNIPKSLMASIDASAPLRQGVFMISRKEFWKAWGPMMKALVSPKYEKAVKESIYRDPLYAAMQDSGLAIPVYEGHNGGPSLAEHEEPYMSYASKIPIIGIGVRASERAYNTFLYKVRADTFKSLFYAGKSAGKNWGQDSLKDLSKFINTFTGRGDLGKFNNAAPILNSVFFSPRLLKSRIDALNPAFYQQLDPFVRKEAIKSLLGFITFAGTTMGLAKFAGAEVSGDPRTADGWKIKIGNTRYDILGGEQQLVRLVTNLSSYVYDKSKELGETGKIHTGFKDKTAIDEIGTFLRNKESPDISFFHDFLAGRDAIGNDFTMKDAILNRITPMSPADVMDAANDLKKQGVPVDDAWVEALIKSSPAFVGVGVQTYSPKGDKSQDEFSKEFSKDFSSDFNFDF